MKITKELAESVTDSAPDRVYAIGDIHGEASRLQAIHAAIRQDLVDSPAEHALIVHLGDFIDRGPDPAKCLTLLAAGSPVESVRSVCLMGNHERMLLDALADPAKSDLWLHNGGATTLESWGLPAETPVSEWATRIPPEHLDFIRDLALSYEAGRYLFVHAGVRPGIRLSMQVPQDLLWIRSEFLRWSGTMLPDMPETLIVHGHTPSEAPEVLSNRIGIDTGACRGGKLTCAALSKDSVYFLQA